MQKRQSGYTTLIVHAGARVKTFFENQWIGFGVDGLVLLLVGVMIFQGMPTKRLFLSLFISAPFLYRLLVRILALFPNGKAKYADMAAYGCALYLIFVSIFSFVIK
jgi:hypothetical protein